MTSHFGTAYTKFRLVKVGVAYAIDKQIELETKNERHARLGRPKPAPPSRPSSASTSALSLSS
eukprot:3851270-Prymnesium_polylepis.1